MRPVVEIDLLRAASNTGRRIARNLSGAALADPARQVAYSVVRDTM
jgi:hypothetical protein